MEKKTVRELVAAALNGAIEAKHTTHRKIVASGAVANGSLGRIRHAQDNFGVDTLDDLSRHLGIEAWQLIHPDLDPEAIPGHAKLSDAAVELALALDAILSPEIKKRVHATAMQVLGLNPEAASPAPVPAPAPPSPAPKPKRSPHR